MNYCGFIRLDKCSDVVTLSAGESGSLFPSFVLVETLRNDSECYLPRLEPEACKLLRDPVLGNYIANTC